MNILITGATGFLGKQLTLKLLSEGHHVYAMVRDNRKGTNLMEEVATETKQNLHTIEGDLSKELAGVNEDSLLLLKGKIHAVYHSAAYLSFDENEREKTFKVNLDGTKHILELAKQIRASAFYYISTAYTLGLKRHATEQLHPTDQPFVNGYEESKCHAEHLVSHFDGGFNTKIFRPSIIIGDSKTGEADTSFALYGVIRGLEILKRRTSRKSELQNRTYKFLCREETSQNFVPVDYVVKVLIAALKTNHPASIYHITNPNPPTNRMLFEMIKEKLAFPNIEMVPSDYDGELTKEEQMFNAPMSVFRPYWNKNLHFDDSNTHDLLRRNGHTRLNMDQAMIERILHGKRKAVEA
ncbi:Nucleoside-diphosphate-sugar epimerase [Halobacillus karajensis]|uniref:SDR family oxidoreductase n=1 Tax=Halobacillus karajensis TaxID=195088 RepID=UPI0008A7BD3D|nr:SDR family oxidoreductase [Halobacillus karajensis]SEH89334.1 Nucleoside-diphosphate-sugar epimerase [Halobacillus karajensis]